MHVCQSVGSGTGKLGESVFSTHERGVAEGSCGGSLTDQTASAAPCSDWLKSHFQLVFFFFFLVFPLSNLINIKARLWKPVSFSSGLRSKSPSRTWQPTQPSLFSVAREPASQRCQACAWQRKTAIPLRSDLFFKHVYD